MLETGIKWQMHLTSETFKSSSGLKTGPVKVDDNIETKKTEFFGKTALLAVFSRGHKCIPIFSVPFSYKAH